MLTEFGPVLLVGEAATAELAQCSLGQAGHECRITADLAEALRLLNSQEFAAVLLDYRLPDGPGWPVLDAARARSTPVIMMTASGDEQVAAEAIQRGASDYRIKSPTLYGELPVLVERLVRQRAGERAQALLASIVGSSDDAIIGMSVEGKILSWNSAAAGLFGASLAQVRGRALTDFVALKQRPQLEQALQRCALGTVERLQLWGLPTEGPLFMMTLGLSPIVGPTDQVTGVSCIVRDVSAEVRAQEEIQIRLRQQAAVAELGRLAWQSLPEPELLERAAGLAARTFEVEHVELTAVGHPGQPLEFRAGVGFASPDELCHSQAWSTLQLGQPVISEDLIQETRFDSSYLVRQYGLASGLTVVIAGEERPFGVLGVYSQAPRRFTLEDVHCLEGLSHVLGQALIRGRTEQALRERAQLAAFEAEIFRTMARQAEVPTLLRDCVEAMVSRLGANLAGAWVLQAESPFLELVARAGNFPDDEKVRRVQLGQFAVGRVAQSGQAFVSRNFGSEPGVYAPNWILEQGLLGFAGYPLSVEGKVVGVLAMFSRYPLSEAVQGALEAVAAGVAQAIERVRSEAALRASQAQLQRVVEGSNDGFWDWHVPSGQVRYSARWADMLGYQLEDVASTLDAWKELLHPEDLDRSLQSIDDCFAGRAPLIDVEYRLRTASGAWKWVLSRGKVAAWLTPGRPEWITGTHVDIDERKRAQEESARSKQRLELMVKLSPLGVLETSPEGKITACNPAAERILGQRQVTGLNWSDLFPKERQQAVSGAAVWHETPDGRQVLLEWLTTPLVAEDGQVLGVTSMCRDVTESRRSEQQLHKLWRALEQSPISVVITDPQATIEYVNPRFEQLTGYSSAEAVGGHPRLLKSGVHPPEFYVGLWQTILSGQVWQGELCNRKKDGELYWERAVVAPVRSPDGQLTNFIALKEDITLAKAMARQLAESDAKFQAIFENMADGYVRGEYGGLISMVNPAATRLLGYSQASELIGQPVAGFFASQEERLQLNQAALQAGLVVDCSARIRRQDGALRNFEGSLRLQRAADGKPQYVDAMFRDATERIEAEQERLARQAAEAASQMKGEFLAHMSHEIRTPLNAIVGMTYLAMSSELTPPVRDYLAHIQAAGQSLQSIVNDILDFSKIEAGRLELELVEFDLLEMLDNLLALVAESARDKGLELRREVGSEVPPRLLGDSTRIGQVLLNLMGNAVKFTPSGAIKLAVAATRSGPDQVHLSLSVEDTGIGMTAEQIGNLFQPFCQADASITRQYGGTGLGLAISRRLVQLMGGGEIQIESTPGQGSRFGFSIPLGVGHSSGLPELRALVLLNDSAHALESLLTGLSVQVWVPAQSPPEAGFDLIFVDTAHLGQLERLRPEHPRARSVWVADPHQEPAGPSHGVEAVLFLPISRSALVDVLHGLVGDFLRVRPARSPAHESPQLGGHRVLVVEDNSVNQRLARELLERAGLQVDLADDGQEAVNRLKTCGPHCPWALVLMDVQMPVLDGYAAAAAIRQDGRYRDLPIVAMTAHVLAEERERCRAAGMNDFIAKPIDPEAMFATLRHWLPVAEPEASFPDFPVIVGLDVQAGLARVAGNAGLYRQLLLDFAQEQASVGERVRQALTAADAPASLSQAHLLKGVAGNLGIVGVARQADKLERLLRAQRLEQVGPCLQELEFALAEVVTAIRQALPASAEAAGSSQPDLVAARTAATRLDFLLGNCDGEAVDCLEDLARHLGSSFNSELRRLSDRVHQFEFEAARTELSQLTAAIREISA